MKKAFSCILAVLMILSCIPFASAAEIVDSGSCGDNVTYTLDSDGLLTISGTGRMTDYYFPTAPWRSLGNTVKSVVIGSGVTSIGDNAFYGCGSLSTITIPDSVTSIGDNAFYECSSLSTITIPESVTSIGDHAFYDCSSLSAITIPDSVTSIGDFAFSVCSNLTEVIIGNSVTSIGYAAFDYCISLSTITIPDSVTSIGFYAFSGCSSLQSIVVDSNNKVYDSRNNCNAIIETNSNTLIAGCSTTVIPDSVTSIDSAAFSGCISLSSITIPDSVTSIGSSAFYECSSLSTITIPDSVTSIGERAFSGCSSLSTITIPDSVTSIGNYAFYGCSSLSTITIPDSVTSIGSSAFNGCSSLSTITIPDSVTSIGSSAFRECISLSTITIPDSVTSIGDRAFYECTNLTEVIIGNSVTSIGSEVFYECSNLKSITIPSSLTNIPFYRSLKDIYYYGTKEQWEALTNKPSCSRVFYEVGTEYSIKDGVLYNKNETLLVDYPDGKPDRYFVVPDGVKSIVSDAFVKTENVYTVILPEGLKDIGARAFQNSNIRHIYIPASVTNIEQGAITSAFDFTDIYFGGSEEQWQSINISSSSIMSGTKIHYNQKLIVKDDCVYTDDGTELVLYASNEDSFTVPANVISIAKSAFVDLKNLKKVTLNTTVSKIDNKTFYGCSSLKEINITSNVNSIGYYAFTKCKSLETISLPNSLTSIELYAFSECSALTDIDIPDSVTNMGISVFSNCVSLVSAKFTAGMSYIPTYTFNHCVNLRSIIIPETVTQSKDNAFTDDTMLNDIYFGGSDLQWDSFNINNGNNVLYGANVHFAHEHEFGEWVVETELGAYTDGVESRTCATCGYVQRVTIPCGHEHSYGYEDILPASCYANIIRRFTCICGKTYEVELGVKGHSAVFVAPTTPTCVSTGNKSHYYCADCGKHFANAALTTELTNNSWVIPTTEHKWVYDRTEADSCVLPGTAYYYCSVCNAEKTEEVTVGHSYTETVVDADCLSRGYTLYVCNKCEYTYTANYTPALGHIDVNKDKLCDICGEGLGGGCSHDFEITYTNATCLEDGKIKLVCKNCAKESEEIIPALDHNYVDFVIEPTCTSQGYTKHYCVNCGDEIKDTYVKALGHAMRAMTITPTCTENGCDIEICDNCGYNYEDNVVKAKGHTMMMTYQAPASCTAAGTTIYECSVCYASETENSDMLGHDIVNHAAKTATCTSQGWDAYTTCSRCDYSTFKGYIGGQHEYVVVGAKKATDTVPGYTGDTKCKLCGDMYNKGAVIPAGSTLDPADYPDFNNGNFEHRNNGSNWDFWYENQTFVNGTQFVVSDVTSGEDFDTCKDKNPNHKFKLYDLKAQNGEMFVQPNGVIWIALNLPGNYDAEKSLIYYVNGATYEKMPCFVKDGKIFFMTTHFSSFAVVDMNCVHSYDVQTAEATCTKDGFSVSTCIFCGDSYRETIKATGHVDADKNGFCDYCELDINSAANNCSHLCHKGGFLGFIWKIINFFNKLFKINPTCSCGAAHY